MESFYTEKMGKVVINIGNATTPLELCQAWFPMIGHINKMRIMACLPDLDKSNIPEALKSLPSDMKKLLIPYFENEKTFCLDDEIIKDMYTSQANIPIDYSISFDTNVASDIRKLVFKGSLENQNQTIVKMLKFILLNDLNFDHSFYMVENLKQVYTLTINDETDMNSLDFWKKLNKPFQQNLVALELFRTIDCKDFKMTSEPKSSLTIRDAVKKAIETTYEFYASSKGKELTTALLRNQRLMLLFLIKMFTIQFKSKKKEKAKITELFDFMHNEIGAYFDRESIIALQFYLNSNNVSFFNVIHKQQSKKGILRKIDNLAWDMSSVRYLETLITSGGEGKFFIPYFLTQDKKLQELYNMYTVKAVIIDKKSSSLIPIPNLSSNDYYQEYNLTKSLEQYFTSSAREQRLSMQKLDLKDIECMIKKEYKKLRNVL